MSLRVLTKAIVVATMLLVVLHFGAREKQSSNSTIALNLASQFAANEDVNGTATLSMSGVNATTMFGNSTNGNSTCDHPPDDPAEACLYVQRQVCADESEFIDYLYLHYVCIILEEAEKKRIRKNNEKIDLTPISVFDVPVFLVHIARCEAFVFYSFVSVADFAALSTGLNCRRTLLSGSRTHFRHAASLS